MPRPVKRFWKNAGSHSEHAHASQDPATYLRRSPYVVNNINIIQSSRWTTPGVHTQCAWACGWACAQKEVPYRNEGLGAASLFATARTKNNKEIDWRINEPSISPPIEINLARHRRLFIEQSFVCAATISNFNAIQGISYTAILKLYYFRTLCVWRKQKFEAHSRKYYYDRDLNFFRFDSKVQYLESSDHRHS